MRTFLKIFLSPTDARLTLWRHGTTTWEAACDIEHGDVATALSDLLATVPHSRWRPRPSVIVIVGAHASRIKHLRHLPTVSHRQMLNAIVRENAPQFFLWRTPFVTTDVYPIASGEAIGGIIESSIVQTVVAACEAAGYSVRAIHPEQDERLSYRPPLSSDNRRTISTTRTLAASGALLVALAVAVTAPAIAAHRAARQATRQFVVLAPTSEQATMGLRLLEGDAAAIRAVARFEEERRSTAMLLASITDILPSESAITMLRIDTATVDLIVISARAADILGVLDRMPGVVTPEIVGPVSREVSGDRELERATIRFRYQPDGIQDAARTVYRMARERDMVE